MSGEPIRLLDDGTIRDELRLRLEKEAAIQPQYDVDRGLARLRAAIGNGSGNAGSGSASEPASAKLSVTHYAVKGSVWRLAGVVGLAAATAVIGLRSWGPARHVGPMETGSAAPAAAAAAVPADEPAAPAPAVEVPGGASTEADDLLRIKASLVTDPGAALALADQANLRFVSGALREEREATAIAALARLGRSAEAQHRAERFRNEFPKSSLSEQVRLNAKL